MQLKNIEFKAKVEDIAPYEQKLLLLNPVFCGIDHQTDTYFRVQEGRLKLREGNIENALIHYYRPDAAAVKLSDIVLYPHAPQAALKQILSLHLGIKTIVEKRRKIYFINNVKFHFDIVPQLGHFVEVEAIDEAEKYTIAYLQQQCDFYFDYFGLKNDNLIAQSYSDMICKLPD